MSSSLLPRLPRLRAEARWAAVSFLALFLILCGYRSSDKKMPIQKSGDEWWKKSAIFEEDSKEYPNPHRWGT